MIVGSFVPLTMLLGIVVMSLIGVELQRMSIAAMIIALGLLVDNEFVVAEDIRVRMERGVDRIKAASDAVSSLAVPLITSSLTTILPSFDAPHHGRGGRLCPLAGRIRHDPSAWLLDPFDDRNPDRNGDRFSSRRKRRREARPKRLRRPDLPGLSEESWAMLGARLVVVGVVIAAFVGSIQLLGAASEDRVLPFGGPEPAPGLSRFRSRNGSAGNRGGGETHRMALDTSINPEIESNVAYVGYGGPRFFLAL